VPIFLPAIEQKVTHASIFFHLHIPAWHNFEGMAEKLEGGMTHSDRDQNVRCIQACQN
jgi:carbonic anhydrase